MPFALGVAIANLFQRIADALNSGGLPSISPIPDGTGNGGGSGGSGSGSTPQPPPTSGPGTGPPTTPPFVPPVIQVPTVNQFPVGPGDPGYCPPLQSVDMDLLANLPQLLPPQLLPEQSFIIARPQEESEIVQVSGQGNIVGEEDFFRFRAFGSAGAVPVTFFGRVADPSGNIRPFSHVLTTDALGTVFETNPRPGRGMLLGAAASVPIGSITTGAVNAIAEIGRFEGATFTPHTLLLAGQLDDFQPLSSTLASPAPTTQRPTFLFVDDDTSLPSPVTFSITPTPGRRVRILRCFSQMTLAVAANARAARIQYAIGGENMWVSFGQALMGSGETAQIQGAISCQPNATTNALGDNGALLNIPLPDSLYFYETVDVSLVIQNGVAADRLSLNIVYYEES